MTHPTANKIPAIPAPWGCVADGAPARCYALITSAGNGSRAVRPADPAAPKQYQRLAGQRVIEHTLAAFLALPHWAGVAVVVAPGDDAYQSSDARVRVWPVGGAVRAQTVHNGLQQLAAAGARDSDWVLVHDAARCLIEPAQIERLLAACWDDPVGGLLALPLPDTLKSATAATAATAAMPRVAATLERDHKWLAQTPQMFRLGALRAALAAHQGSGYAGITDEASAIERSGAQPLLVPGSASNFKITYPADFALAEALLAQRQTQRLALPDSATAATPTTAPMNPASPAPATPAPNPLAGLRIGEGWDIHALVPGRPLILGGIHIPHPSGLLGHSDADALLHAITDALLGAAALGDIGTLFPDTDARFAGADSAQLLAQAMQRVAEHGYALINLDTTVIAQAPKLAPYKAAMQARIAEVLGLQPGQVNVKAKTAEKLGPVGQGLAIECRAVALLQRVA
ncbi:2-C-methyl-D-erythritol 2,4-cyclodiphosphate synthase [Serpentinimonas raichei]|uniref:2-C-methyl-D-erythritol 2,4-cyclodiphosphate synthase n=1 Tax=Serpentinimonas raichei TaxID=1458425 RepID=UPI0023B84036|nr:2-C-methyl-D-erythritol 2,4-cyclodiphosphate synthase [Serpentinimonas raichei]